MRNATAQRSVAPNLMPVTDATTTAPAPIPRRRQQQPRSQGSQPLADDD